MTFRELGLSEDTMRGIDALGFENPTPVQEAVIPHALAVGGDIIALAQTGTGKTAGFGLPLGELIDWSIKSPQAVIVCPTRELAVQISNDFKNYFKYVDGAKITPVYGGASISDQVDKLKRGTQVIVATPGRLLDLLGRKRIKTDLVKYVVLDEADEMLNMGFKEELDGILDHLPSDRKTWLFSATMPKEVERIAKNYMSNPHSFTLGSKNRSAENLQHFYFLTDGRNRYNVLKRTLDFFPDIFGLVFCKTRLQVRETAEKLSQEGYDVDSLHGDLSQQQREAVLKKFRGKFIKVLVATDVAARGIDVADVTHVIHYMLPDENEAYTHRSGRTARAGKQGTSISIITNRETRKIKDISKIIGVPIEHMAVPTVEDVTHNQLEYFVDDFESNTFKGKEDLMAMAKERLMDFEKEQLIEGLMALRFNDLLSHYKDDRDLNAKSGKDRGDRDHSRDDENMKSIFINIGHLDDVDRGGLLRIVCDAAGITSKNVGRIDVKREFSFVDVDKELADGVVDAITGLEQKGRKVRAEITKKSGGGGGGRSGGGKYGKKKSYGGDKKDGYKKGGRGRY